MSRPISIIIVEKMTDIYMINIIESEIQLIEYEVPVQEILKFSKARPSRNIGLKKSKTTQDRGVIHASRKDLDELITEAFKLKLNFEDFVESQRSNALFQTYFN